MPNFRVMRSRTSNGHVVAKVTYDDSTKQPVLSETIGRVERLFDNKDYPVSLDAPAKLPNYTSMFDFSGHSVLSALLTQKETRGVVSLASQFGYEPDESRYDSDADSITLEDVVSDREWQFSLEMLAARRFNLINPLTGDVDVDLKSYYAHCIPLVINSGAMTVQKDDEGNKYFNPNGVVSVAEFLNSLAAFKYGESINNGSVPKMRSLDNISDDKDFFNAGYAACLSGISSPFYRLYSRGDLREPITRAELAYITVVCWTEFEKKYGSVEASGQFALGCHTNWEAPQRYVNRFTDGKQYKVYKKCSRVVDGKKLTSISLKDYASEGMSAFKNAMRNGEKGIPLPMFMSLFELDALGLFKYCDNSLLPLQEVSRGELAYFITQLARRFPEKRKV